MRGRLALFIVLNFMLLSLPINASGQSEVPSWRSVGIDPDSWTDGPVKEDTPMNQSYQGNAVLVIEIEIIYISNPEIALKEVLRL